MPPGSDSTGQQDHISNSAAPWWRRNCVLVRAFCVYLLPLLLLAALGGWNAAESWAPRQRVNNVYVVCPADPQQWCGVVGGHIVSRVRRP